MLQRCGKRVVLAPVLISLFGCRLYNEDLLDASQVRVQPLRDAGVVWIPDDPPMKRAPEPSQGSSSLMAADAELPDEYDADTLHPSTPPSAAGSSSEAGSGGRVATETAGVGGNTATPLPPPSAGAAGPAPRPPLEENKLCGNRAGYVLRSNEHCYFFVMERVSWNVARDECRRMSAQLATLTSLEEQQFVSSFIEDDAFWIGLSRFGSIRFDWLTGEPLSFTHWAPDAPQPQGDRGVVIESGTGDWYDRPPSELHRAICER